MKCKIRILEIKMLEGMQLLVHLAGRQKTGGKNCGQLKIMVCGSQSMTCKEAASFL